MLFRNIEIARAAHIKETNANTAALVAGIINRTCKNYIIARIKEDIEYIGASYNEPNLCFHMDIPLDELFLAPNTPGFSGYNAFFVDHYTRIELTGHMPLDRQRLFAHWLLTAEPTLLAFRSELVQAFRGAEITAKLIIPPIGCKTTPHIVISIEYEYFPFDTYISDGDSADGLLVEWC